MSLELNLVYMLSTDGGDMAASLEETMKSLAEHSESLNVSFCCIYVSVSFVILLKIYLRKYQISVLVEDIAFSIVCRTPLPRKM